MKLNRWKLFVGAGWLIIVGITIGSNVNPQMAMGLGLMWIGLAVEET